MPKTVYPKRHCKVELQACSNLPEHHPYILGCGRLLHACNSTLQCHIVATPLSTIVTLVGKRTGKQLTDIQPNNISMKLQEQWSLPACGM